MKTPRWPPESAGFRTAGKPTVYAAAYASCSERAAAKRGWGTPASASRRRIATLCVIRCAVFVPMPGSPSASATAATTGTARSAETVRTPSTPCRRPSSAIAAMSPKSTTSATSAWASPAAPALPSTATTRKPSCFARRIARRWCRPAPTKTTVFTCADTRLGGVALTGKRFFVTGGAGFIGTRLARRLVEDNELVVLDNLHRDALTGTELDRHPNLTFHQGDVLDAGLVRSLADGATHIVHLAAIAG